MSKYQQNKVIIIFLIAILIIAIVEFVLRAYCGTTLVWWFLDAIQTAIAWLAIAWETVKIIFQCVLGNALEIVTLFFYASFVLVPSFVLGIDSWWMFLVKILVTLGFLIALRIWGPFERWGDPQDDRFYRIACWVGMVAPPWGFYMLRRWRPFGLTVAVQWAAVMFKIGVADRIFLFGVLVLASLAVWGWDATKERRETAWGKTLMAVKIGGIGVAGFFIPPLAIILLPLLGFVEDVEWGKTARQTAVSVVNFWLASWASGFPLIGWPLGWGLIILNRAHIVWFWWQNRSIK